MVRMPKAYPVYDERLPGQRGHDASAGWLDERAERAPGRPQRHAPVQQPGPLDVHRHAHRGEHRHGASHDIWNVNVEEEYHETTTSAGNSGHGARGTGRDAPVINREHYGHDHPLNKEPAI